ncbi:AMP-binding protein [Streptomyces tubbatahanensis]|uniref:AMP-binding protein n=1 Tax=Streptomyces tubbatahanensis TaxID=2923272 RepID=A0ABY3XX41_9ACTN|nr:AMP-binding protein [Streptomyces tubbatahanensis]UNS99088.1 AMP-binding protein [Streptomyces tubbatahanensis]
MRAETVPAHLERAYVDRGYWRADLLDDVALRYASRTPDRPALIGPSRTLTYGRLAAETNTAAAAFAAAGLRPGDAVAVRLPNTVEVVVALLGLLRAGVVPVLVPPAVGEDELRHVVAATKARGVLLVDQLNGRSVRAFTELRATLRTEHTGQLGEDRPFFGAFLTTATDRAGNGSGRTGALPEGAYDLSELLAGEGTQERAGKDAEEGLEEAASGRRVPPRTWRSADLAVCLLSGGSTGPPKVIPRTHRDYVHNVEISARLAGLGPHSRYLAALPVTHNFALGCPGVLGTLATGGTVVLSEATPNKVAAAVAAHRVTVAALVPGLAKSLAAVAGADFSSLEVLQAGGAKLHEADARRLIDQLGCRVQQVFGMAEGLLNFTRLDDPDDVVAATQGRPASPGDEWRTVGPDGRPVPAEEGGELQVRGPYTIRGYLAKPEVNAAAFTEDGWFRTGDIVRLHESGNFVVTGRRKDFINRGGEKVAAAEIEGRLAAHPAVSDCAAVPAPHDFLGETVCVFVVPAAGAGPEAVTLHELRRHLRESGLPPYGLPESVRVVEALPQTAVGKPDRAALTRLVAEPPSDPQDPASPEDPAALPDLTSTS